MSTHKKSFRLLSGLGAFALACSFSAQAEVTVLSTIKSKTPEVGYNASVMRHGSNGFDWLRYSGVKNIRVFISPTSLEPVDDIAPHGDGVVDQTSFNARVTALRNNAKNRSVTLSNTYVNWPLFKTTIDNAGENYLYGQAFPVFNSLGVDILATLQAYKSRFPLDAKPLAEFTAADYANMWELWQHYYAVSFTLARYYKVHRYSMYNEPNLASSMTPADLEFRLRIVSDAVRAGIADSNSRYRPSPTLVAQIFAPNTGGPAYDNDPGETGEDWGRQVILNRHKNMWGVVSTGTKNLDVYNYQKYTLLQHSSTQFSGFIETCQEIKDGMTADMGTEAILPVALTEMNARTGSSYASQDETADTPKDFVAVGATGVALVNDCPTGFLYLFKFGMMERASTSWDSMLAKNGTHYVNIDDPDDVPGTLNNYGGASGTGEVWRLFNKATGSPVRNSYNLSSDQAPEVWMMVTRNTSPAATHIYIANRSLNPTTPLSFNFSALPITSGSVATIEEVSQHQRGGVVAIKSIASNRLDAGVMPPESVWLISIYHGRTVGSKRTSSATANTQLQDGVGANTVVNPTPATLLARADGTANGRKLTLIKFNRPSDLANTRILLQINAAQIADAGDAPPTVPTQAHVYGITYDGWSATSSTLNNLSTLFKKNVGDGQLIANNVVLDARTTAKIQGQLFVDSTTAGLKYIDVTDFVKSQTDSVLSFLIVQEHRWDYHPGALAGTSPTGEAQEAGIGITSRANSTLGPKLIVY